MYVAFIVLSWGLLVHGQTATETIPLSSYVQTTQPAVTPEVAQCVTINRFSKLEGLCVTRARCDYGTAAIDSTLYKPRGAKSPCPSDKVCCPNHYIIPDTPPKDDSNRNNQNGIHSSESNLTILSCLSRMKSIMESISSSISKAYAVYAKFCNETTLHGLKHTVANNLHFFERLLWFILTVCAFAGAVYCGVSQLARYNSEPVVVSMERDYRDWSTAFPAVTACFLERVGLDKAKDVILRIWNVTEDTDSEKYQYYYEFVELIAEISFRSNLQNFWKYQNDDTVKNIDLLDLAVQVHPNFTLKVTTSKNIKVQWMPIITEEGLCMTFNSEYALYQIVNDDLWRKQSLMKCHYHSESCFVRIDSMENGARYFIHSPFDIATAISNPTGEIFPGDELVTDFKVVEIQASTSIKGLRPEQRRCRYPDEWLANSIKAYSFGLCQMHCRSRMAVMFCGCRPYFHVKGDGDVCDAHGMACIGRNVEILVNLPKNLAKCPCMPQCAELNYYSHTKKVIIRFGALFIIMFIFFNMNDTSEDPSEAIVKFTLMPPKFRLHRDIIFSLDDLFSSLGGTTSLFVGTSVLTVVETCLFIIRYIVSLIVDWYSARKLLLERR